MKRLKDAVEQIHACRIELYMNANKLQESNLKVMVKDQIARLGEIEQAIQETDNIIDLIVKEDA